MTGFGELAATAAVGRTAGGGDRCAGGPLEIVAVALEAGSATVSRTGCLRRTGWGAGSSVFFCTVIDRVSGRVCFDATSSEASVDLFAVPSFGGSRTTRPAGLLSKLRLAGREEALVDLFAVVGLHETTEIIRLSLCPESDSPGSSGQRPATGLGAAEWTRLIDAGRSQRWSALLLPWDVTQAPTSRLLVGLHGFLWCQWTR